MGSNTKKKLKRASPSSLEKNLLRTFIANPKKRFTPKQIKKKLKINNTFESITAALNKLVKAKKIIRLKENIYKADRTFAKKIIESSVKTYQGRVDITRRGAGFIIVDGLEQDVFVPARSLMTAMDGDKVLISINTTSKGKRPEGRVLEVLDRNIKQVVGKFRKLNKFGIVEYNGKNGSIDIYIKPDFYNKAKDGDSVLANITAWGNAQNKSLWGEVKQILTETDAHNFTMQQILVENGFELQFPSAVLAAAKKLKLDVSKEEVAKRRDLREITTLTIDPLTAQDFDDALSIRQLENENWEIGIHIADVSHYVKKGSAIDKEAFDRSTSVYLVDRCVPMLPEVLSNRLCSLRPDEDSLCFSAIFEFNKKYKIVNEWFGKTIIHSDRRFTYEEAQEIIEAGEGEYADELLQLNKVSKLLRKERFKNGAISFESEEIQFVLDDNNVPVDIYIKERKDAHLLVEDFMLLANKSVATYIIKKGKGQQVIPFVYRIHDVPNEERMEDFKQYAKEFGFNMKTDTPAQIAKSFNQLAKDARKNDALTILEPLAIRTMSKAVYSTENIGHYGLAFDNYSHFTSPIRRYSDLLVHRILEKNLDEKVYRENPGELEAKCVHISNQERKATTAERESIKFKQVEWMSTKIGEDFEGMVSGMIDNGIFVEIKESKAEGFIRFEHLDEKYQVASNRLSATGMKTGQEIGMGTKLKVKLLAADLELRQIDLKMLEVL